MDRLVDLQQLRFLSKYLWAWLPLYCCLSCANFASAQTFPYVAYVTGEQEYVRSGPGQRYYPTGQVPQGYAVEVYRHDGDGWCAIRPTEGSFSWVSSHEVRPAGTGIVEVVGDNVVTRVGSTLSPNRSAVQVLLPRGELLEMIAANENDDPRWIRVAAPAGEFRWIAASSLSRQPPMEVSPPVEASPLPKPEGMGWSRQSPHTANEQIDEPNVFDHLSHSKLSPKKSVVQPGLQFGTPTPITINEPAPSIPTDPNAMDVIAGSPAELQLAQYQNKAAPPALLDSGRAIASQVATAVQPRVRFEGLTPTVSATVGSVEELELRLSQAVVEPPQQWQLGALEEAANSLLAQTKTPPVRAQLREVLERITRFQEVQQRYNNPAPAIVPQRDPFTDTASLPSEPASKPEGLTGLSSSVRDRVRQDLARDDQPTSRPSTARTASDSNKPLYDATGLLKPVVSKRPQAPQYALVDEQGKVLSFVTPTPDLNLKPYVGRRIGVHGARGFMPEYRRAHVTAGRVTPIDGTVRR